MYFNGILFYNEFDYSGYNYLFILATKKTESTYTDDDPCKGKADGKYPLRNVLEFLTCKKGKGTVNKCPTGEIYFPTSQGCGKISRTSLPSFCRGRSDGDWQNPWNCNRYILCKGGATQVRPCLINGFIYSPEKDACLQTASCVTIPYSNNFESNNRILNQVDVNDVKSLGILLFI